MRWLKKKKKVREGKKTLELPEYVCHACGHRWYAKNPVACEDCWGEYIDKYEKVFKKNNEGAT